MFCPGGRPPVLLTGASGRVTGACTCRSPLTGGTEPVVGVDTSMYLYANYR